MVTTARAPRRRRARRECVTRAAAPVLAAVALVLGACPAAAAAGVERLAGADRVMTAVAVARDRFPEGQRAAVLARSDDFADAVAGAGLAAHVGGPLLLTEGSALDPRVAAQLQADLPPGSTVWLLGGTAALNRGLEEEVSGLGFGVERVAGADRYGTAAAIAAEVAGPGPRRCDVVLATGEDFPDAVAASGLLRAGRSLLFTRGQELPAVTAAELAACHDVPGSRVTAVGGPAAAALHRTGPPPAVSWTAVVGEDRYETSALLLRHARSAAGAGGPVVLATGADHADALVGSTYGHPVLLTATDRLPSAVTDALVGAAGTIDRLIVLGGEAAVSRGTATAAAVAAGLQPPGADAGWEAAWATGDHEVLRAWFEAQGFGPDQVTGDHPGGVVRTQADADALRDKRVTGDVVVDGDVTVESVFFDGARVDVTGGTVTLVDVHQDVGRGTRYPNYLRVSGTEATVHLERVEVENGQDGIQSVGAAVTGDLVYVHSVSDTTGELQGDRTHQDGWQHMRGSLDVDRSFLDYRGARTSVLMLKPDHGDIPSVSVNRSVLVGGGPTHLHVHDAGSSNIGRIDLSDNLVAGTSGRRLASVWEVNAGVVDQLRATSVRVSPGGQLLAIQDAARLP